MTPPDPQVPPVHFNHLFVVLDEKTYRAILASDYLRIAFPGMERRSTLTAAGETWSGAYYYCQDSYIELFGSGSPIPGAASRGHWQPGAQEGWAGLAFSTSQAGGAAVVRDALQARFHYQPHYELRQLNIGDRNINWFTMLSLAERIGMGSFDAWLMEYHREIFDHKGIRPDSGEELTTRAYLSPWNDRRAPVPPPSSDETERVTAGESIGGKHKQPSGAGQKAVPAPAEVTPPVFTNVTGATIHLDHRRAQRFAEVLSLLGYAQNQTGDCLTLAAHDFTLRICPENATASGYRLSALRLAMARPSVAPMTFVFAPRSRLVLKEDLTADWFFGE